LKSNSEIKLTLELLFYFIYFIKKFTVKLKVSKHKNSLGDEIANVNFLRPHRKIHQNIIRCWIFNTTQAVVPRVGVASRY